MVWTLMGIVIVGATFVGVFSASGNTWQALNLAGLVSAGYVLFLVTITTKKPFPRKKRRWIVLAVVLAILITGERWRTMYEQSQFQAHALVNIRKVIENGVFRAFLMEPATKTLRQYYLNPPTSEETLSEVFHRLYPPKFSDATVVDTLDDGQRFYLASETDSLVMLVGQSDYVMGRHRDFRNHDGQQGRMQSRVTVTEKGIAYESEN